MRRRRDRPPRRPAALAGLLVLAACNGGTDPADPPTGDAPVDRGGVAYTADTRIMESFPVQLDTRVTMRNTTGAPVTVELGSGCPVHLRVYRSGGRDDLVWDQSSGRVCTMQIQVVELQPEESEERSTRANAGEILGDSLPDGRYWLSALVSVVGGTVEVPAGSADLAVPR